MSTTTSVEFPTLTLLLMALVVALGYGISLTSFMEDVAIIQQLVGLK